MADKLQRAQTCNDFLKVVAGCGRRFFAHKGSVSRFEIGRAGHVYFRDAYTGKAVYTAYKGRWRGFSEGGTLHSLVEQMADFIRTGTATRSSLLGPWPTWYCGGDLWGYGEAMPTVRAKGLELGIFALPPEEVSPPSTTANRK